METAAWRKARATSTVGDCAAKPPAPPIARFIVDSSWQPTQIHAMTAYHIALAVHASKVI
jgi:hypothetical protein